MTYADMFPLVAIKRTPVIRSDDATTVNLVTWVAGSKVRAQCMGLLEMPRSKFKRWKQT